MTSHFSKLILTVLLSGLLHAAERPNIIFILCDDLGYGDLGVFHQNQRAALQDPTVPAFSTPQLDQMAGGGMIFTRHYCGAPVCAPSRASLLTGLTQGNANVRDNQFDKALADTHTLGTVLQKAGYSTAAIGKWGLQGADNDGVTGLANWPAYPTKRGFDFYYGYIRHMDGHFHYPKEDKREVWENDREVSADLDLCYTTDLFTARAKKWITDHTRDEGGKPFFLNLAYDTPHAKLQNPPCPYPTGGLKWIGTPHAMINAATGQVDGWMHPDIAKTDWPDIQKRHANGVRRIDDAVGDMLGLLAELKIAENTLVVFTSDNGPSRESYLKQAYNPNFFHGFGPFDGIKRDMLEGGIRVPAIVRWPRGIKGGGTNAEPSGQWDWLATFAELAGIAPPAASDGVSLVPLLTGKGKRAEGLLYSEYAGGDRTPDYPEFEPFHRGKKRGQMQVVFEGGYKGIRTDVKSAAQDFEIYDVTKDLKESKNLAAEPGMEELQKRMKARALQLRRPDAGAPRPYDADLIPALTEPPQTPPGANWSLYQGNWPWMPDFRTLAAAQTGICKTITLPSARGDGAAFHTNFLVPADGSYTFKIYSNGGVMLFVHEIRVIDEAKTPETGMLAGSVRLQAGWHPLRILHRQLSQEPFFQFSASDSQGRPLVLDETNLRQKTPSK